MKKIILFSLLAASLSITDSMVYNCVDCEYDKTRSSAMFSSYSTTIVHEKPEPVKVLIQNYNCPNCGLFEVSIRKNEKNTEQVSSK